MSKFSQEERNLLIIQTVDAFIHSMAGIFLTVFLFVNSDLQTTLLFSLITFIFLLFWYVLSGITLQYVSSGSLIRFSLFCSSLFYLWIFIVKEDAIRYLIPLAIFNGFRAGNYWAAFNLNQYIFTHQSRRVKYFGSGSALINLFQAVGPLIGGIIISLGKQDLPYISFAGYAMLFFIVALLLLGLAIIIGKLPKHDKVKFSYQQIIRHIHPVHPNLLTEQSISVSIMILVGQVEILTLEIRSLMMYISELKILPLESLQIIHMNIIIPVK